MDYKMILMDMDGTLLNSNKLIASKTKSTLMKLQEQGVRLVLASGRPNPGLYRFAQELQMDRYDGYLISYNGANLYSLKEQKTIWSEALSVDESKKILEHLKDFNVIPMINDDEYMYVEDVFNNIVISNGEKVNIIEYESRGGNFKLCEQQDLSDFVNSPLFKILVAGDEEYLKKNYEAMQEPFASLHTCDFTGPVYFEYTSKHADKGKAFEVLADHLNIAKKDAVAFGDGMNDMSLLNAVGTAVAMENAVKDLKQIADFICPSNDEDGIAVFFEDRIYEEKSNGN